MSGEDVRGRQSSEEPALTPVPWAVGVAAAVFMLGFGAMNVLWFVGDWDANLPGLYDFRSATWGDGFVLPTLAFLLVRLGRWHERGWSVGRKHMVATAAATAFALAVATQVSWLWAPEIDPNWTFPTAGTFNIAGWYHAGFFALVSGLLGALGARAWLGVRTREESLPQSQQRDAVLLVVVSPLFLALWATESLNAQDDLATFFSAVWWGLLVPGVLVLLTAARTFPRAIPAVLTGAGAALAVTSLLVYVADQPLLTVMTWFAVAVVAPNLAITLWLETSQRKALLACVGLFVWATAVGVLAHSSEASLMEAVGVQAGTVLVVALILVWASMLDENVSAAGRRRLRHEAIINGLFLAGVIVFGLWSAVNAAAEFADGVFVVWSLAVVSAITYVKALMRLLIKAEDEKLPEEQQEQRRIRLYQWGVLSLIAVLIIITLGEVTLFQERLGVSRPEVSLPGAGLFLLVQLSGLAILLVLYVSRHHLPLGMRRTATAFVIVSMCVTAGTALAFYVGPAVTGRYSLLVLLTLAAPGLGLFSFVMQSVVGNVYHLRGRDVTATGAVIAVVTGLLVAGTTVAGLLIVLLEDGVVRVLAGVLALVATLIPLLVVELTSGENLGCYVVRGASPRVALHQDPLLSGLMCLVVLTYPVYNLLVHDTLQTVVVRSVAVLGIVAGLYGWVLTNNVEHARKYRPQRQHAADTVTCRGREPDAEHLSCDQVPMTEGLLYREIRAHTRRQNVISALMLVPVVPYLLATLDVEEVGAALLGLEAEGPTVT